MYLGLDLGTTNVKAMVTDMAGRTAGEGACAIRLFHVGAEGVEQELEEIWRAALAALRAAVASAGGAEIHALGVSSQGGALQVLGPQLEPIGRVISWLDRRGQAYSGTLPGAWDAEWLGAHLGRRQPGLAVGQLLRLRQEAPGCLKASHRIGFVGDLVVERLCGRACHDGTSAGLTGLYNPHRRDYEPALLDLLGIARQQLPLLTSPREAAGGLRPAVARETGLRAGLPVSTAIHDQYAAALSAGAVEAGTALLGTGTAWVLLAVTGAPAKPATEDAFLCHHLSEGLWGQILSLKNGGSSLAWALELTGRDVAGLDALVEAVPAGSDGLKCWPFLASTGAAGLPVTAAGRLDGLRLTHGPGHLVRAVLEGLAYELARHVERLRQAGFPIQRLVLGGPAAESRVTPQLLAAVLGLPLGCAGPGASPLGAAILARGLLEPGRSLGSLSKEMAPPVRRLEPGELLKFYQAQYRDYLRSLPLEGAGES